METTKEKAGAIVYGPQGCGKTSHAEKIAAHLGLSKIADNYERGQDLHPDTLHLTNDPAFDGAKAYRLPYTAQIVKVLQFADVAKTIGIQVTSTADQNPSVSAAPSPGPSGHISPERALE